MKKIKIINRCSDETYPLNLTDEQVKLLEFLDNNELLQEDVIFIDPDKEEYITL